MSALIGGTHPPNMPNLKERIKNTLEKLLEEHDNLCWMLKNMKSGQYYPMRNQIRDAALSSILAEVRAEVPEEKNFNAEVSVWRDGPASIIQEVRGNCKGHNACRTELLRRLGE